MRPMVGGTSKEIGGYELSVYVDEHMRREQEGVGEQTIEGQKA
jgi:hypothetical protein